MNLVSEERRLRGGATSLRTFFDEQIDHLHTLFATAASRSAEEQQQIDDETQLVEEFVDASNTRIRIVHGFAEKLRLSVRALHAHVLGVAEVIPPPVPLNPQAFRTEPVVNALFVSSDEIDRLFQRCHLLESGDAAQNTEAYALLTALKNEKAVLGVGMLGDLLVRDVAQKVVNFSSHKLQPLCNSGSELKPTLTNYLFDRVVGLIKREMTERMTQEAHEPGDKTYETRMKSLTNPEVYLNTLIEYLAEPAALLSIETTHFRLNKLGVKLDDTDSQCANEFDIPELTWGDHSRHVLLQITYGR